MNKNTKENVVENIAICAGLVGTVCTSVFANTAINSVVSKEAIEALSKSGKIAYTMGSSIMSSVVAAAGAKYVEDEVREMGNLIIDLTDNLGSSKQQTN